MRRRLDPNPDVDELLRYQGYRVPPKPPVSLPAPLQERGESLAGTLVLLAFLALVALGFTWLSTR